MTLGRSIRWIVWSLALGCGADDIAASEAERGDAATPSYSQEPLVKLEPPSADGRLTTLTHDPMFAQADIMAWDLSFDASTLVIAARRAMASALY